MGGKEKETGKRTTWGEGGAVCLLFTGHPRHWAPTDSYDSRPAQTRRLFCGSLVAFVPRRVVPVQLPRRPFPPRVGRDGSSAFFFHRLSTAASSFLFLSQRTWYQRRPDLLPLFPPFAPLSFRILLSFSLSIRVSPSLSVSFPSRLAPLFSSMRPYILRPVVAFFWSLFPRYRAGLFAGKSGAGSRMGRTVGWGWEDEAEALSRLKGADVTYGSRPDCTQLFRRAILMPWTPSTNHPFLSLLSS